MLLSALAGFLAISVVIATFYFIRSPPPPPPAPVVSTTAEMVLQPQPGSGLGFRVEGKPKICEETASRLNLSTVHSLLFSDKLD